MSTNVPGEFEHAMNRDERNDAEGFHRSVNAPRLAASSYLNTAPLIWSFLHGSLVDSVELVTDKAPARSAELLARRAVDFALVPVIEYARIADVELIPGVCVGARRRVRSVVLATRGCSFADVRSVNLDAASRTSAVLVEIIFREFLNREVRSRTGKQDEAGYGKAAEETIDEFDARLVIGDPAMRLDASRWRIFDLAEVWHAFTGCGFVFAMWMRNKNAKAGTASVNFAHARDEGLAHTRDIIKRYGGDIPLSPDELQEYLHENISYRLDRSMREGLRLYFQLAHKHRLIPHLPAIEFAADAEAN